MISYLKKIKILAIASCKAILKSLYDLLPYIDHYYKTRYESEIQKIIVKTTYIVSPKQTLDDIENAIINNRVGCYLRFGDGDIFLATGRDDMLQKSSAKLKDEMHEALLIKGEYVFKCLMIHSELFGYEKEMFLGNHKNTDMQSLDLIRIAFPYFIGYKIYSPVALHFEATYNVTRANIFLKHLKSRTQIFIGNENISSEIVKKLFGNASHIKTPSQNAYDKIERIEKETIKTLDNLSQYCVVCLAMGCAGRPMIKRLFSRNYNIFLFDFGSLLDGICGDQSRTWMKVVNVDYNALLVGL
jgi:hypothetical protein